MMTRPEPIAVTSADELCVKVDPATRHPRIVLNGDPLDDRSLIHVRAGVLARLTLEPRTPSTPPTPTPRRVA
jgi:hypothetical protein